MAHYLSLSIRNRRPSTWFDDHGQSTNLGFRSSISESRQTTGQSPLTEYQVQLAEYLSKFTSKTSKIIKINVGGQIFQTYESTLRKAPDTLLAKIDESSAFYNEETDSYFFDKSPIIFQCVLDFYRDGEMHIPRDICVRKIEKDLLFWEINFSSLADCCKRYFEEAIGEMESYDALVDEFYGISKSVYSVHSKVYSSYDTSDWKIRVWEFLDDFTSSRNAKIWHTVYMILVIVSILTFFCSTLASCRVPLKDSLYSSSESNFTELLGSGEIEKVQRLLNTSPHPVLQVIELACLIFFTVEFIFRVSICPWKKRLLKNMTTVFDLLYIIPGWIVIFVEITHVTLWRTRNGVVLVILLEAIEVFRVFRIFRFIKHHRGLRMLYLAIRDSLSELSLLMVFVLFSAVIFASLIYGAESFSQDYFDNAFDGMWWALITMTTVGYGDMYPTTWLGYIVGSVCALVGIIMIQMPVPIIVSNFHAYYRLRLPVRDEETINRQNSSPTLTPSPGFGSEKSVTKSNGENLSDVDDAIEKIPPTTTKEKKHRKKLSNPSNKVDVIIESSSSTEQADSYS